MICRFNKILSVLVLACQIISAQTIFNDNEKVICSNKFSFSDSLNLSHKPINQVFIKIAKSFIGTEYAAGTLEEGNKENLVVNLSGVDCYTFLEASLAFARCIKKEKTLPKDFEKEIELLRYRNGVLKGYPSRLHYFSDWIYDNDDRQIISDVSKSIGGIPYNNSVNFMSEHSELYKRLKDDKENIGKIKSIEKCISKREYYYLPEEQIDKHESKIKTGDIIGFTTDIKGLDISHTGIAIRMEDGKVHLLHAPNVGKKVQITKESISDYALKIKRHTGIIVARINELSN